MTRHDSVVLVLGGGNALGAYHAGVYQALHEAGCEPDWVVGTSAGALSGALIAGNAPADRVDRLAAFWQPGAAGALDWLVASETARRTAAVAAVAAGGAPGKFGPVGPLGSWWDPDTAAAAPALYDSKPMRDSIARLCEFGRLNAGAPRFTLTAVDVESGEDVVFDTTRDAITPDHVRGSGALPPVFPPVAVAGRRLVDGGLSQNVPLDPVLADPPAGATLCIAVDLLPLAGRTPRTLGETIGRAQDLTFAIQTRRTLARWRGVYAHDPAFAGRSVTLALLTYADQGEEVGGKAMDFSGRTIRRRWDAGARDATALLASLPDGTGRPGLIEIDNTDH